VRLAIDLAGRSDDGWAHLDDFVAAARKKWPKAKPTKGNIKKTLDNSARLKSNGDLYAPEDIA
jgi:hypothetical protein